MNNKYQGAVSNNVVNIIVVDFGGTLVQQDIISEANKLRSKVINRELPTRDEHAHNKALYKNNQEALQQLTGLTETILYRTNTHEDIPLTADQIYNHINTTLFQIGLYEQAHKHGHDIYQDGILAALTHAKSQGYELAIVSGVRTDIISGILAITQVDIFDHIIGQPPILGVSQSSQLKELASRGKIVYVIGDEENDLQTLHPTTKKIFVQWGVATGGEEQQADYSVQKAHQLQEIFSEAPSEELQ